MFHKERTCAHSELKVNKNITDFFTVKGTLAFSVYFWILNNFTELHLLPIMEFSINILPR